MRVSVLGAGSWGTTVAALAAGHNATTLWARDPDVAREVRDRHTNTRYLPGFPLPPALGATSDMEEAVADADMLLVAAPSHGFRATLELARPHTRPWVPVVSLAKGFEPGTHLRMTEVVKQVLPAHPAAALTGPNLAKEIMAGCAAATVVATEDLSVASAIQHVLRRGLFRIYLNDDVLGCEVGGALKNVIAIATGMAEGLSAGDNTRAAVMCRGLAELARLGVAMGGRPETFAGLAGMGDLMATCMSPQSRNRSVGEQLGRGGHIDEVVAGMSMVAEGVKTAVTVTALAEAYSVDLPICRCVDQVVRGEATAADAYSGLLRSAAGHEREPG